MADHPVVACYRNADSASAVRLASRVAAAIQEPLVLTCAYDYEPVVLTPGVIPTSFNEQRFDLAQTQVDRARRLVPQGLAVREDVVPAEGVPEALADLAHESDACLLAVGRDIDGHVARTLLQRSPCPLAVVPGEITTAVEEPLRSIGLAWDGSAGARFALQAAMHLAIRSGAGMRIITVGGCSDPDGIASSLPDAIRVDVLELDGDPGRRLVEASADLDLLVSGSHGRGRLLGAVLGSVSAHLLDSAECPVMVVPPRVRARAKAPLGLTTAAS